ncbi:MAG TPA: dephospho-CoA kinase [Burkholderiaceae bacterium]|nr:dephospho-CoA kinase [Burkholderiaceae bacterium]
MLKIGLTGGIGSGKTQVANFLAKWGASVIDTDEIARALTATGGQAIPLVQERFGASVIGASGAMDRAAMREAAFRDPSVRLQLEGILHPLITAQAQALSDKADGCYVVFVVPLLIESGHWRDRVDRICVVDCDPDTQIARVQTRSGLTLDTIERIMSVQASRQQRLAAADDVIHNGAQTTISMLEQQARHLHRQWCGQ